MTRFWDQNRALISANWIEKAMVSNYHTNNDFFKAAGINGKLDQLIIYNFGNLVNNDKDWVIYLAFPISWN